MQFRRMMLFTGVFSLAALAQAQQPAPAGSTPVIRVETKLVLVDTVVTDKKGNYVRDLTQKEFRVWEDNKEQEIKNFSFGADPANPSNSEKHYLVLFFDNSTMQASDQIRAREAAGKFIDSNAGENRLMAIVNFGGSIQIAQNFTADADRLQKVVSGVKFSSVAPNAPPIEVASMGMPTLRNAEADFGARSVMLALRSMAKNLSSVPGRKTLILFTSGFPWTDEFRPELTAVIDACNRANVAVYPIDVRGLVASGFGTIGRMIAPPASYESVRLAGFDATGATRSGNSFIRLASFGNSFVGQRPGGGGGGAGGGAGGGGGVGGGGGGGR